MNTRKILLISDDKDLISIVNTSALTLTKLNCQVSLESISDHDVALERCKAVNLDLVIADNDAKDLDLLKLIGQIRNDEDSKNKKIIFLYTGTDIINKNDIFKAGCDSIMTKEEFKRVVNNILVF